MCECEKASWGAKDTDVYTSAFEDGYLVGFREGFNGGHAAAKSNFEFVFAQMLDKDCW